LEFNRLDVTAKELIWDDPAAWLERYGVGPPGPVEIIESEATIMTASADKVLKVGGETPYLVVLEPHTYHDSELVRTLWYRQVALDRRHGLPVLTILILLRKEANSPSIDGRFERRLPDGWLTNRYNYRVIRLWEEDPESYLTAGVNLVPLVPLTKVGETEEELWALKARMAERINAEPAPRTAMLWTAMYFLMGIRYPEEFVFRFLEGVQNMRESTTYQAVLREGRDEGRNEGRIEGRVAGEQRMLLRQGTKRFGEPDAATIAAIEAIQDIDRLEALGDRIVDMGIQTWDELLGSS
jgi:hypothetical protein